MAIQTFQHRFENVEDYLHHRAPYLMVDRIVEISDRRIVTTTEVREDMFFLSGHFPGAPIVPGAMMQEMTTQSAGILIAANFNPMKEFDTHDPFFNEYALGVLVRLQGARYRGFARPGDQLQTTVTLVEQAAEMFDFKAEVHNEEQQIVRNGFRLANIKSKLLQGTISA